MINDYNVTEVKMDVDSSLCRIRTCVKVDGEYYCQEWKSVDRLTISRIEKSMHELNKKDKSISMSLDGDVIRGAERI